MWNKFLFDLGLVEVDEPFKKLVNQGMILGKSLFIQLLWYRENADYNFIPTRLFISNEIAELYNNGTMNQRQLIQTLNSFEYLIAIPNGSELKMDLRRVPNIYLNSDNSIDIEGLKSWRPDLENTKFFTKENNGKFYGFTEPEKMSKSKWNVVNPDEVIDEYGADCFRVYEMFLGPLDAGKPWDTKGITGVYGFLRKLWRLFIDENGNLKVTDEKASNEELKILHKTIKKAGEDIERLGFNTAVSAFMICVNELGTLKCYKKEVLEKVLILVAPFAPFIAEELWEKIGNRGSIHAATWPVFENSFLVENSFNYPVSINGKARANVELPLDMPTEEIERTVLALESVIKWTEGKTPKKVIIVKGKIVNVVV